MQTFSLCPSCKAVNRVPFETAKTPICGKCKTELLIKDGVNELAASSILILAQKSPLPVVVDFWAPWCGPCLSFAPTFKAAAREMAGRVVFAKINTEAHPLASDTFHVKGIPTLVLFKNGIETTRQSGSMTLPSFMQWLNSVIKS